MNINPPTTREGFKAYLHRNTRSDTGTIASYLRGMDLLPRMIAEKEAGFADCADIWHVDSIARIHELLLKVREEQKLQDASRWCLEGQKSYLKKGFIKAALGHYRHFLLEIQYQQSLLDLFHHHAGDPDELAALLNQEPELPDFLTQEMEGKEAIRETKVRINQGGFRKMILESYQNRCCITGLDVPELCIASHIIPWADNAKTRMDPRNGLCLSATYDKAFDQHLITLDENYRIVISNKIREHYQNDHARELFEKREGQMIQLPAKHLPKQEFLEKHRSLLVG
ncbi:HNH endonuclease [Kiritimatiellaeota bacterium B1221]|nr:HNH endonuclease [Kiritimatiellaeota bacterium B1221]